MSTTNNRLQISAAVLLLLAGCGGGGGGSEAPKAVSASPSATTTTATNAAAANAASTAAANTAAQRAAEQAATQAASQANAARNAANQATAALQAAQAAAREAEAKRAEAEAANKRAAEAEAALQKATAERRAAEEAQAKAAREEAARKQAEAEAAKKAKEEADAKAKVDAEKAKQAEAKAKEEAEAAARAQEEAAAAAKAKEEAEAKAKAEEEAKAKAEEEARQAAARTVPASSNDGVSGLMLATMLDQAMTTSSTQQGSAYAYPAESVSGSLIDNADAPTVLASQYTSPSNYVGGGSRLLGTYQPANGIYHYYLHNGGVSQIGKDSTFKMNTVGITLKIEATADKLELDESLRATDDNENIGLDNAPTFTSGEDITFQKNALVSRIDNAGVIGVWHGPNRQSVQLVLAESSASSATLCWNYTLTNTNRLYCNRWQIPNGWQAGQELTFLGYYIHESRTVDGGQKNYYWHTR